MSSDCCEIKPINIDIEVNQHNVEVEVNQHNVEIVSGGNLSLTLIGQLDKQTLTINSNGQTIFALTNAVPLPDKSLLFLNGQKQTFGIDYNINNVTPQLNWLGAVLLRTTFILEIYY